MVYSTVSKMSDSKTKAVSLKYPKFNHSEMTVDSWKKDMRPLLAESGLRRLVATDADRRITLPTEASVRQELMAARLASRYGVNMNEGTEAGADATRGGSLLSIPELPPG